MGRPREAKPKCKGCAAREETIHQLQARVVELEGPQPQPEVTSDEPAHEEAS